MRLLIILLALALVGCSTGNVTVIKDAKIVDGKVIEGKVVAHVTGNAAGRTVIYKETEQGIEITVKDERMPNPAKGLIDIVGNFFKAMWSKADVAIPI